MSPAQRRFAIDAAERIIATFVVTFIGQYLASGVFEQGGVIDMSTIQKAALSGLFAVLTLVKTLLAKYVGSENTAAMLPASDDTPKPEAR